MPEACCIRGNGETCSHIVVWAGTACTPFYACGYTLPPPCDKYKGLGVNQHMYYPRLQVLARRDNDGTRTATQQHGTRYTLLGGEGRSVSVSLFDVHHALCAPDAAVIPMLPMFCVDTVDTFFTRRSMCQGCRESRRALIRCSNKPVPSCCCCSCFNSGCSADGEAN